MGGGGAAWTATSCTRSFHSEGACGVGGGAAWTAVSCTKSFQSEGWLCATVLCLSFCGVGVRVSARVYGTAAQLPFLPLPPPPLDDPPLHAREVACGQCGVSILINLM